MGLSRKIEVGDMFEGEEQFVFRLIKSIVNLKGSPLSIA